jgi:hypothetical protein
MVARISEFRKTLLLGSVNQSEMKWIVEMLFTGYSRGISQQYHGRHSRFRETMSPLFNGRQRKSISTTFSRKKSVLHLFGTSSKLLVLLLLIPIQTGLPST